MGRPSLLKEVLKWFIGRPVTIQYPYEETPIEERFRGRHFADLNKCTGCSLCAIECPADAITMEKLPEGVSVPKNPRRIYPVISYGKCVYCYRCVTVCPFDAYVTTNDYKLVGPARLYSRDYSLQSVGGGVQ